MNWEEPGRAPNQDLPLYFAYMYNVKYMPASTCT